MAVGEALGKIRKALFHPKRGAKAAALLRQLVDAQLSPATAPLFRDCLTAAFLKQPAPAATAAQGTEEAQQAPHDDSRATEVVPGHGALREFVPLFKVLCDVVGRLESASKANIQQLMRSRRSLANSHSNERLLPLRRLRAPDESQIPT